MTATKMSTQALLDINPDKLFETHTIADIKNIQIRIQDEIEKKRQDLRTMVGEKCRDLLKAANTITDMKSTSDSIILHIAQTKQLCQRLQEKRLIGFRQSNNSGSTKSVNNSIETSKVIEIKILLSLPEQIWTAIDNKDYLSGAQLYLLATHLHVGLEVASNDQTVCKKYPVLNKQWEIITSCKKTIIDGACVELKNIDISPQKAAECLSGLILLEILSYEKLLNRFLDLRMASLNQILTSEALSRKKLHQTIKILQNTLTILYICFSSKSGKPCAIENELDVIIGEKGQPTLTKLTQWSSLPQQYLSPLIVNFHPKIFNQLNTLSQEYIKQMLSNWLDNVEKLLKSELNKILLLIDDIKRLHTILIEDVFCIKYSNDWEEIVNFLFGVHNLNIYDKFVRYYVTKRVKELIKISWQNGLNNVLVSLNEIDEDAIKDRGAQFENDIRWFVWKENKADAEEGLKLKTFGYTPRVMELCVKMDSFLTQLLNDLIFYIGEDSSPKFKVNSEDDCNVILPFLHSFSLEMIRRFARSIKDGLRDLEDENIESKMIIRARFLSSLVTHCPGLEKCLRHSVHLEEDVKESKVQNAWQQATVLLIEESNEIWQLWRESVTSKIRTTVKSRLSPTVSLRNLLKSKPLNEIITIEEQTEDGTNVESDLRVPSQPSLPLQELLFQVCQQLNAIVPHTLPRQVHQDFVDVLVKVILEHYLEWSKSEVIYQSQAWQMLLDVRFLTLLLVTKENKDLSQTICELLEKTIDPFDLDVYFPHLQNSVKKSTQKLQGTFGVLVNFSEKLPVFNGLKLIQSSSKVEEPNLIAVSASVPWFPLLPVTNFGNRKSDSSRFDSHEPYSYKEFGGEKSNLKTKEKGNKKESMTSDFFKSAGAFFDAVTGGWS